MNKALLSGISALPLKERLFGSKSSVTNMVKKRGDGTLGPAFNDWEIEMVERFMLKIQVFRVQREDKDKVMWTASKSGAFSVKSLYSMLESGGSLLFPCDSIWRTNVPPKAIGKTYCFALLQKKFRKLFGRHSNLENSSQIFELKTKLWHSKQGDREVTKYYNKMKALWQELDLSYHEEWDYAKDSIRYMKRMENDREYVFLAGRRGRILGKKPLSSLH
uniref:Uncharacterized protein n=1 Tax=Vitis vinifera TaxID=29760 RepID=A5B254_VITVI|nr:hypothetical protein VITISV_014223 [Vitis vinifera]